MESSHAPVAGQNPCPASLHMDGGVPLSSNHPRRIYDIFPGCPKGLCFTCMILGLDISAAIAASEKHFKHS